MTSGRFWRRFWRDLFTGRDAKTYDLGRVLWCQCIQLFVMVTIYGLYRGQNLDLTAFGTGLAALLAGGGAGIAMKSSTEPKPNDDNASNQ